MYAQQRSVFDPETEEISYISVVFNSTGVSFARTNAEGKTIDAIHFSPMEGALVYRLINTAYITHDPTELHR